jgi:hypothetical protein
MSTTMELLDEADLAVKAALAEAEQHERFGSKAFNNWKAT